MEVIKRVLKFFLKKCILIYKYIFKYNINNIFFKKINLSECLKKNIQFNQRVYLTGKGKVYIGNSVNFGYKLGGYYKGSGIEIQPRYENSSVIIGNNVSTNNNILIVSKGTIKIGNNCLIGHNCEFLDHDGHGIDPNTRTSDSGLQDDIIIGNNVWFGNNCNILKGSKIGDNSIVAANSLVKGIYPNNVIIGGIPARIIRYIK